MKNNPSSNMRAGKQGAACLPATDLRLTTHATVRAQQRGLKHFTLDLLMRFGKRVHDHRGGCIVIFDKHAKDRITRSLGKSAAQLKLDAYAVIDPEYRTMVDCGHRTQRVRT